MQDIIKAMRVLAELSDQVGTELDSLVDESKYKDNMVITSRMAAMETFCYLGELLGKAADRLEAESIMVQPVKCSNEVASNIAPKDGGWIEWGGGECPVSKGTMVEVKYRHGNSAICPALIDTRSISKATAAFWRNDGMCADIIAYRVVKP